MQGLEAACEEGECSAKRLKASRPSLPLLCPQEPSTSASTSSQQEIVENPSGKPPIDIFAKLLELYEAENGGCGDYDEEEENEEEEKPGDKLETKYIPLLLEKLVAKERLNTLILNLYPGNKGYSLAFRTLSRSDSNFTEDTANMIETELWPYEEDDLLRYIGNEELPPFILDLLETQFSYLFYNGCIIAEVRDYRQAYPQFKCDIHHVLLRPTARSIMADINNIVEERPDWTNEEKDQLECQLLMANAPSLCLDPDTSIGEEVTEIYNRRRMWNTHKFRRMAKKFSQVTVNRKRKLDQFTHRHGLEFYEFLSRVKSKPKIGVGAGGLTNITSRPLKMSLEDLKPQPIPSLEPPLLAPPQEVVINVFKSYERPEKNKDESAEEKADESVEENIDCSPQLIEEYILETDMPSKDKGSPRVYHIKLSILQRPSDSEYLGELYLDRDHKKNEQNGVACRFSLGSRANANRYIHQFTEIFTESGRKSVRISYRISPRYKEREAQAQAQARSQLQAQSANQPNLPQQHLTRLTQSLQNQTAPVINGTVAGSTGMHNQVQVTSNVPILQSHLQGPPKPSTQEQAVSALATELMNSAQKFQAESAKKEQQQQQQRQQQQKLTGSNTAILNLLNSSPASNVNTDAVVNAINNSQILPQQIQTINQKILARKMTIPNVTNARVLTHNNVIAINNNRMNLQDLQQQLGLGQQQPQTITLTSVNSSNYSNFTSVPIKQQVVNQRIIGNSSSENKALSALLVGTPAADRPDIKGPNTNSLLLEKLGGSPNNSQPTHFIQSPKGNQQFMVQSPKGSTVLSPMSSPPPQTGGTINVQGLNFAQLQSIPGFQVQLPGFSQPISLSLNVSSTGNIQGHPTSLIVSLPVTTATQSSNTVTQAAGGSSVNNIGVAPQTVVLSNASASNLAQLVSSGVKGVTQQGIRTSASPQTVSLTQGRQPFQLITPLHRPRMQQATAQPQTLTSRTLQRTPITIKMATPGTNASSQVTLASNSAIANQLQKQAQLQQYQQICLNQPNVLSNIRRRSSTSDPQ